MGINGLAIMSGNQVRQSIDCIGEADAPELFLKHGKGSVANDVTDEMVRLNWLTEFITLFRPSSILSVLLMMHGYSPLRSLGKQHSVY